MSSFHKVVETEIVIRRVGLSVVYYIIYILDDGKIILSNLDVVDSTREITKSEYEAWKS